MTETRPAAGYTDLESGDWVCLRYDSHFKHDGSAVWRVGTVNGHPDRGPLTIHDVHDDRVLVVHDDETVEREEMGADDRPLGTDAQVHGMHTAAHSHAQGDVVCVRYDPTHARTVRRVLGVVVEARGGYTFVEEIGRERELTVEGGGAVAARTVDGEYRDDQIGTVGEVWATGFTAADLEGWDA